jgi:hypothetical protein
LLIISQELGIAENTPSPYLVSVKTTGGAYREVGVFLPHEQLHLTVRHHGIDAFRLSAAAWDSEHGLANLLRAWGDSPEIQLEARDALAIGFHADGVSFGANQRPGSTKSVLAAAWNVISAESPANRGRRHLYFALAKALSCDCGCEGQFNVIAKFKAPSNLVWFHEHAHSIAVCLSILLPVAICETAKLKVLKCSHIELRAGHCTFDPLMKVFAWSMECLKNGMAPLRRHDDTEFTAQDTRDRMALRTMLPRAALLQARGDWEWLCQCFRFRHFGAENFCWLCDATYTGPTSYLNIADDAPYRQTRITHDRLDYQSNTQARMLSYLSPWGIVSDCEESLHFLC